VTADAAALPFDSNSVDAVLALCVFDSLARPYAVRDEIRRVLTRGGTFVHFLDAATNVETIVSQLVEAERLPLPNFFADTSLLQPAFIDLQKYHGFLHPYVDLLSVPIRHYQGLLDVLTQANHPMLNMLERYARPFIMRPFDSLSAARSFVALTSSDKNTRPLNQALTSLISTLSAPQYSSRFAFDLRPHSTLTHFQQRLEQIFNEEAGFLQRMSSVVYARAFEKDDHNPLRAQVLRVGIVKNAEDWPVALGTPAQQLHPEGAAEPESSVSPSSHVLREAAVYCFVAEKTSHAKPPG